MTLFWYVLITDKLSDDFDKAWKAAGYKSRSEALRDLARKLIKENERLENNE